MGDQGVRRRGYRAVQRHVVAMCSVVALLVGAVAFVVLSPPSAQQPEDFHGRTWLSVSTASGPQLVLVNGISGLIEGRAQSESPPPAGAQFVASSSTDTLMGSSTGITVVDNGRHDAVSRSGLAGDRAVLVGSRALTLDESAGVVDSDLEGDVDELPATPAPGAAPVVDGEGRAWFLARDGSARSAERLADDGASTDSFEVDSGATELLVIDGTVFAAGESGVEEVDGDRSRPMSGGARVFPRVAESSGDLWATASGRTVTTFDGDDTTEVRVDAEVTELAVWYGSVIVTTADGAAVVADGDAEPIGGVSTEASVHADGGMLWVTSTDEVVAIDRDQHQVAFRLAAIDLDVCVGTCDPDDISRFLEEQQASTTTTAAPRPGSRSTTTTTAPPRDLRTPPVEPTVPTTTTTSVAPSADDRREPQLVPTTGPDTTTSTTAPSAPELEAPDPPSVPGPSVPGPSDPGGPTRPTPPDGPDLPPPTSGPDEPGPEIPPPTPPTTSPTPTTAPPQANGLVLEASAGQGFITARVGVTGSPLACPGIRGGGRATAILEWSGAASGSRNVEIRWPSRDSLASVVQDVTIPDVNGGRVDISLVACAKRATTAVDTPIQTPQLSSISVNPEAPEPGGVFNAGVGFTMPAGWNVTSAEWNGGACAVRGDDSLDGRESRQSFTASPDPGLCRVSVVVTFAPPGGGDLVGVRSSRDVNVVPTTTTTTQPPTTTTTRPTTTTTTTTQPTTTTTTTTTTTAAPTPTTTAAPPP